MKNHHLMLFVFLYKDVSQIMFIKIGGFKSELATRGCNLISKTLKNIFKCAWFMRWGCSVDILLVKTFKSLIIKNSKKQIPSGTRTYDLRLPVSCSYLLSYWGYSTMWSNSIHKLHPFLLQIS